MIITNRFKATKLDAKDVNGIRTQFFLTKTTDQVVKSKINFGILNSNKLHCSYINGINLTSDTISLSDKDKLIRGNYKIKSKLAKLNTYFFLPTGPVTIDDVTVQKDLYANIENSTVKPKFQQIYKTVKITGVVRIENLHFQPKVSLTINGKSFNINDISNRFWLKHTDQVIPRHVRISRGAEAPYLLTDSLNNIKMERYMVMDTINERLATIYRFRNLSVFGSITIDDAMTHIPNLFHVYNDSVKLSGRYF